MKLLLLHFSNALLAISFTVVLMQPAAAQLHTLSVHGYVTSVDDENDLLQGDILVGDSLSGIITYDLSCIDNNSLAEIGDYWYYSPPSGMQFFTGNYIFKTDSTNVSFLIEAANDYQGFDNMIFHSYNNVFPTIAYDFFSTDILWQLDDVTQTANSNTELPQLINIESWQQPIGLVIYGTTDFDNPMEIRGVITMVDSLGIPVSIPNPILPQNDLLQVHTNPSNGIFHIHINEPVKDDVVVRLFNFFGKEVSIEEKNIDAMTIDITSAPAGIYFLEWKKKDSMKMLKLIKL